MKRNLPLVVLTVFTISIGIVLFRHSQPSEVSLRSVQEIAGEAFEDLDKLGQRLVRLSEEKEMEIGQKIAEQVIQFESVLSEGKKVEYVERVGRSLLSSTQRKEILYRFYVVDAPYANAFALPGGHIYITTRLLELMETEAELAFVLGHEISHVDLRHCIELFQYEYAAKKIGGDLLAAVAQIGYVIYRQGYTKQKEFDADTNGFYLAVGEEYDPRQAIFLLEKFARLGLENPISESQTPQEEVVQVMERALTDYLRSHPPSHQRIEQFERLIRSTDLPRKAYVGRRNYRELISRVERSYPEEWEDLG